MKKSNIFSIFMFIFVILLALWSINLYLSGRQTGMLDAIVMISLGFLFLIFLILMAIYDVKEQKEKEK